MPCTVAGVNERRTPPDSENAHREDEQAVELPDREAMSLIHGVATPLPAEPGLPELGPTTGQGIDERAAQD